MALSNAEQQARWRERNQVVLTDDLRIIANKLIEMEDQAKLGRIASYINDHLKHPDRSEFERSIALGLAGYTGVNGDSSNTAALARAKAEQAREIAPPEQSWMVEAATEGGKRWRNGVRLKTKEEAETYIKAHVPFDRDLEKAGYVTAWAISCDDEPNCSVIRNKKGARPTILFPEESCVLLDWQIALTCG